MTITILLLIIAIAIGLIYSQEILDGFDTLLAWMAYSTKQTAESYCEIQTADSPTTLVNHDGSLLSIIEVHGYSALLGQQEFNDVHQRIQTALSSMLSRPGYSIQVFFGYNKDNINSLIRSNFLKFLMD